MTYSVLPPDFPEFDIRTVPIWLALRINQAMATCPGMRVIAVDTFVQRSNASTEYDVLWSYRGGHLRIWTLSKNSEIGSPENCLF